MKIRGKWAECCACGEVGWSHRRKREACGFIGRLACLLDPLDLEWESDSSTVVDRAAKDETAKTRAAKYGTT